MGQPGGALRGGTRSLLSGLEALLSRCWAPLPHRDSAFIALLGIGVLRRWRWTFWLITVAFLFGVLRIPASVLTLKGVLPADGPTWYVLYQGFLGLVQFAIALLMLVGYRRAGTWGAFEALTGGFEIALKGSPICFLLYALECVEGVCSEVRLILIPRTPANRGT